MDNSLYFKILKQSFKPNYANKSKSQLAVCPPGMRAVVDLPDNNEKKHKKTMIERTLLANGKILAMSSQSEQMPTIGWVGIEGDRIKMVSYDEAEAMAWADGDGADESVVTEVVNCAGCIVMPGLINTHSHISMTLLRNYADDMELHTWLNDYIWPFEAHLTTDDIYNGAKLAIVEMLLSGTTTFVDMYFKEYIIAQAVDELGIRALLTETLLDFNVDGFTEAADQLREAAAKYPRVMAGIAPHAPYTCSPEQLQLAVEYAERYDLPLTIHLSETASEREMIESKYSLSPLAYLQKHGVISRRTILAHSIYLTEQEIDQIAESGASIAHNAQSNMKLASGVAPIVEMQKRGVNCTIATDGVSSNNDLDMWDEMRSAALLQRVTTLSPTVMRPYEVLYMATRGGAQAIGRDDLGEISVGKRADIIVVDTTKPHMRPSHNLLSALLYSAKSSDVRDVMVDGVLRVVDGELVDPIGMPIDTDQIIAAAEASVERIVAECV